MSHKVRWFSNELIISVELREMSSYDIVLKKAAARRKVVTALETSSMQKDDWHQITYSSWSAVVQSAHGIFWNSS